MDILRHSILKVFVAVVKNLVYLDIYVYKDKGCQRYVYSTKRKHINVTWGRAWKGHEEEIREEERL